ncbi:RNA polymerase II degradation factor 1-like isoform X11 [Solanum stenotomum]|uniref:RNA polymerase II degradation factor 1-like isoform X11 n=1 Tax=Solanum stenotomum TaxID=172797 RepID=UPI0020D00467|nr:RNA polymerase II degradation factor 1-like isoform X11 [Solanum stenotomum]
MDSSSSSSQQNQYPSYPASQQQSYNPSRFQAYDRQSYYSNYQDPHQQQQPQIYHHQQQQQQPQHHHQQPQQQYSSYYPPNYSNSYPPQHPQAHQQWNHQEPPIHPPGVSIQPFSASHGQPHFQLPNQQNGYHLPQRTDGIGLGMNPVAALAQLNQLAGSVGAAERLTATGGLHGQSWYPQAQGFGPVIGGPGAYSGPGLGSGAFPGNGAGPSGLHSHVSRLCQVGQSLDKGGDRRRGDVSNSAGVGRCDLCNVDCGCLGILKMHLNGKRHKRNLEKLEANENRTVSDVENVQKPSGDLEPGSAMKPDNLLVEEETKQKSPQNVPLTAMKPDDLLVEEETKQNPPQHIPLTDMMPDNLLVEEETQQNPPQNIPLTAMKPDDLLAEEETKQNPPQNIPLTDMKPDNLLVEEETQQNPPQNIPLDTSSSENELVTEQKINNAQQADPPKDANRDSPEKKPMMNQSGNQRSSVKRKTLVGGRKKNKASKARRLAIEPSNSNVAIPLMCDLCNVQCDTREILRQHLLGRQHKSALKCVEGHHPIYGQAGLQAIYPPNPITNSLHHSQGAQQVLNGAQASDPIAGASLLPQNENAVPSATGVVSDS